MDNIWIKIFLVALFAFVIYREILKTAAKHTDYRSVPRTKANFSHFLFIGAVVGIFTYAGMSLTRIETRDLRPYLPSTASQMVSIFDPGVIELNGMVIKTNLAKPGELASLANKLTQGCEGNDGCEAQKMFDYVTAIPYHTDHTSRNALDVIETNWGDCDDKTNLYASLLNEKKIDYKFVYVPNHVFMAVHLNNTRLLPFLAASLTIQEKKYYYAETTASHAKLGEFNGQFPSSFEGIYDLKEHRDVALNTVVFRMI